MKKIIYALLTIALVTNTTDSNSATPDSAPASLVSAQISTTDIFNYLNTNLGLTTTQKPVVKKAVDEAGAETLKLNADATMSAAQTKTAKAGIINTLIKKLSSSVLNEAQSKKLTGLTGTLTSMFAQLK